MYGHIVFGENCNSEEGSLRLQTSHVFGLCFIVQPNLTKKIETNLKNSEIHLLK